MRSFKVGPQQGAALQQQRLAWRLERGVGGYQSAACPAGHHLLAPLQLPVNSSSRQLPALPLEAPQVAAAAVAAWLCSAAAASLRPCGACRPCTSRLQGRTPLAAALRRPLLARMRCCLQHQRAAQHQEQRLQQVVVLAMVDMERGPGPTGS